MSMQKKIINLDYLEKNIPKENTETLIEIFGELLTEESILSWYDRVNKRRLKKENAANQTRNLKLHK